MIFIKPCFSIFWATKPFADFDGNWNAEYFWTIDKKSPAEFVDTRTISTKNKMVKALNHQEPTESRRLWREVTEEWISLSYEIFEFIYRKTVIKIKM